MSVAKLIMGIVLLVFNVALAMAIPNYISQLSQGSIEIIQIGILFMGVTAPIIGLLERD